MMILHAILFCFGGHFIYIVKMTHAIHSVAHNMYFVIYPYHFFKKNIIYNKIIHFVKTNINSFNKYKEKSIKPTRKHLDALR